MRFDRINLFSPTSSKLGLQVESNFSIKHTSKSEKYLIQEMITGHQTFLASLGASKLFFKITPAICLVDASACSLLSSVASDTR